MARKKKKKATPFNPFKKKLTGYGAAIITLLLLGFGNWFAHQPSAKRASFGQFEPMLESLGAVTADATDALGLTGRDIKIPFEAPITKGPVPFGWPKVEDPSRVPDDIQVLKRQGYWVGYSPTLKHPVWAAYAVPTKMLLTKAPDRPPFKQDPQVKDSPTPENYTSSGYDRGHFAPNHAIATRYGRAAQVETFLMTNIVPQKPELNRGPWMRLEQTIANELSDIGDTIWVIVCSVPDADKQYLKSKMGKTKIRIPEGFCMVVASVHEQHLRAFGVYMPQSLKEAKHERYCFRSIREIEDLTGLNFFSNLRRDQQDALEKPEANRFWPTWSLL